MVTRRSLAAALPALALARPALAQASWPGTRPIEIIVPFPPGGGMDIIARGNWRRNTCGRGRAPYRMLATGRGVASARTFAE